MTSIQTGEEPRRETKNIIKPDSFVTELRKIFKDIDDKAQAEQDLIILRQTTDASYYTVSFKSLILQYRWGDKGFCAWYYDGLNDTLKDKLSRYNKPSTLEELIKLVLKINEQMRQRRKEKKEWFVENS